MKKQKVNKNLPVIIDPQTKEELERVLTDKQQIFCLEYVKDFNATDSYKRAGYKCKGNAASVEASKSLRNPNVSKYIGILKNDIVKRTEIDIDYIIKNTVELIERCLQHRPVLDRDGNPMLTQTANGELAAAYIFDAKSALGGLALLAQHVPGWKVEGDVEKGEKIEIVLRNYLGQPNNTYFPVTPETEHLAKLLGIDTKKK